MRPVSDLQKILLGLASRRCARGIIVKKLLEFRRADFAQHPVSYGDQNRQCDDGSRLDRRVMRDVADRAGRVGAPRVMVRKG
jgi:hypothetical protein